MAMFDRDDETKVVILVRQDLKMSKGKTAAQVSHAAVHCALQAYRKQPSVFSDWDSSGQKTVCLKVQSQKELFEYKAIADAQKINTSLICDAGRTEVEPGTFTVMGVGPAKQSVLDKITGELSML